MPVKNKPKKEPTEKVVLTKITNDMKDEYLRKAIADALDELLGPEGDGQADEKKEKAND